MECADVIIVGGGHGGAQAALALRQQGFAGSILPFGRELEPPYEPPPLSKEYLAREKSFERLNIRPQQFWVNKQIQMRLGRSVTTVHPANKSVTLDDGSHLEYGHLIDPAVPLKDLVASGSFAEVSA